MSNAQRQSSRQANSYLRQTLSFEPEVQWALRRRSIGLTYTLPVDMESQAVLQEERRIAVEQAYRNLEGK